MTSYPFLSQRLFNVPLALSVDKAAAVVAALSERLGVEALVGAPARQAFDLDPLPTSARDQPTGYDVIGGVGVVPIDGVLVHRSGFVRPVSGLTGYDSIRAAFLGALDDPAVKAIVLDVDSPGGEVGGLFDLADTIYAARGMKPIHAVVSGSAYSAAYALASAADRVTVPRTGGVGSVGVILMLTDFSRALKGAGLAVHFVHFGSEKARETRESYTGVSAELLARIQRDVDAMGMLFVETVARNRGLSRTVVKNLDADYFLGEAGVRARLADDVMAPDDAFRAAVLAAQGAA